MQKRFVSIWFRYLSTDWFARREPALRQTPFVLAMPDHGRMVVTAVNALAEQQGVHIGLAVADARAIFPSIQVMDDKAGLCSRLLNGLAEWCIRYTPWVAIDAPDGLILDATGCAHLWNGENEYVQDIIKRFKALGYHVQAAMTDTIGTAWAVARFAGNEFVVESRQQPAALFSLPPAALRLEAETTERLQKLGLYKIKDFMGMPRSALRRRFGQQLLKRLDEALGLREEVMQPVQPVEPYQVRLPCLEPILTRTGIEIALQQLLHQLCERLQAEQKGLRTACFKCFRVDGKIETIHIGTNRGTHNTKHLFKLFEIKLDSIEPAFGIEFFLLEAGKVEEVSAVQEKLWNKTSGLENAGLSELLDRFTGKFGADHIHRYVPDEHYWPERSFKPALTLNEQLTTAWKNDKPRPIQLLAKPEPIEVTAPIPDYPPMLFRYKDKLHKIIKADGPERIEQEWWLQDGQHRDYYCVEDAEGYRYWLFRLGHYDAARSFQWFLHGFFA